MTPWPGGSLTFPLWAVLIFLLLILFSIALAIIVAAVPSAIIALFARRMGTKWIESRAIFNMSQGEIVIVAAAATCVAVPLGIVVGFYRGSFISFFLITWLVTLPLMAIILFSHSDRHR